MAIVVDRDVLLEFLVTFARYEFALKTGGFAKPGYKDDFGAEAQADWASFAGALPRDLVSQASEPVAAACGRLLSAASWKLVIVHGEVMWQQFPPARDDSPKALLETVQRLRNNLFHGNDASGVHGYLPEQLAQLLPDTIVVVEECVYRVPKLAASYEQATL